MRGLRTAALLGAGFAAVSVSVASAWPRRPAGEPERPDGAVGWIEDGGSPALGEVTVWPPPRPASHRGRGARR